MAQKTTNYYQLLGLSPEVSSLEIKRAYRKLVKSYHPDVEYIDKSVSERDRATELMMRINEAYEILIDKSKRAAYDSTIGANGRGSRKKHPHSINEGEEREQYLRHNFHPSRQSIVRVLNEYKKQLADLSQDIFDNGLVEDFERYVDDVEATLLKAATSLSSRDVPGTLRPAVQMMRYSIAQAADGLEELRRFCQNYDYNHLHMAGNLFKEAIELCRKGLQLTKC